MNAYEIARAEATRVVEAAYHKAVAAGELPEGSIPPVAVETPKDSSNGDWDALLGQIAAALEGRRDLKPEFLRAL